VSLFSILEPFMRTFLSVINIDLWLKLTETAFINSAVLKGYANEILHCILSCLEVENCNRFKEA
jgi:hypothetical protein